METTVVKEAGSPVALVTVRCAACNMRNRFDVDEALPGILCGKCEASIKLDISSELLRGGPVDRCCHCGESAADAFWIRKDFDPKLGVAIVVVAAILAFWTYGISLLVATIIDAFLYWRLPPVTTCYYCHAEYRRIPLNPEHGAFDLAHQEDIEQEQATQLRTERGIPEPDDGPVL
jgi:hypothetical protein